MSDEERVKRIAEIAVKECYRTPNAHSVEECMKCQFHPRSCNQWQLIGIIKTDNKEVAVV